MDTFDKQSKPKSREYPAITLNAAIDFIEKLKDYIPHKPISYEIAAKACGVKTTTNSFKYTLSSARQYGLISTSTGKIITFLEPSKQLTRPTEGTEALQMLKIECFKTPKLNGELITQLNKHSVPSIKTLENILVNQYGIMPAAVNVAATTFLETAEQIGIIQNGILDLDIDNHPKNSMHQEELEDLSGTSVAPSLPILKPDMPIETSEEFAAPLNISFGNERRAILYMPVDASQDDAIYVQEMISLMFKRVYGVKTE